MVFILTKAKITQKVILTRTTILNRGLTATTTAANENELLKTKTFLQSISRNSLRSKNAYKTGLEHLNKFLQTKYSHNIETILEPLSQNNIDVYELLDKFVSYLLYTNPDLTRNSIKLYLVSIRSYLAYYDIDVIPSKFRRKVKQPKVYREERNLWTFQISERYCCHVITGD